MFFYSFARELALKQSEKGKYTNYILQTGTFIE